MGSHPHQPSELAAHLDYTLLKPDASREEIKLRCQEAAHLGLNAVTLHSSRLTLASLILEDSPVKICCVVGFPFGAPDSDIKRYETEVAIDLGAEEIALVINPIHLKDGQPKLLFRELRDVVEAAETRPVKVVFCQGMFTDRETAQAIELVRESGAGTIELLGGVRPEALSPEDFLKIREQSPEGMRFKVTGPLTRQEEALAFLKAGVHLLGTPEPRRVLEDDADDEVSHAPFRS